MSDFISNLIGHTGDFGLFLSALINQRQNIPNEVLIIIFFFIGALLFALSLGRSRMIIAIISLYPAAFISSLKYYDYLSSSLTSVSLEMIHVISFIIVYIVSFLLLSRVLSRSRISTRELSLFFLLPLVFIYAGFLLSLLLPYVQNIIVFDFPNLDIILKYTSSKTAQNIWAVLPLIALSIIPFKRKL